MIAFSPPARLPARDTWTPEAIYALLLDVDEPVTLTRICGWNPFQRGQVVGWALAMRARAIASLTPVPARPDCL